MNKSMVVKCSLQIRKDDKFRNQTELHLYQAALPFPLLNSPMCNTILTFGFDSGVYLLFGFLFIIIKHPICYSVYCLTNGVHFK